MTRAWRGGPFALRHDEDPRARETRRSQRADARVAESAPLILQKRLRLTAFERASVRKDERFSWSRKWFRGREGGAARGRASSCERDARASLRGASSCERDARAKLACASSCERDARVGVRYEATCEGDTLLRSVCASSCERDARVSLAGVCARARLLDRLGRHLLRHPRRWPRRQPIEHGAHGA
jgi:hypothetical protein